MPEELEIKEICEVTINRKSKYVSFFEESEEWQNVGSITSNVGSAYIFRKENEYTAIKGGE